MRTRGKFTAVAALALAGSAIAAGALVTSHAMAASSTPTRGTLTVVSMQPGDADAIECTYDDVELLGLPALPAGEAVTARAVLASASADGSSSSAGPPPEGSEVVSGIPGTVEAGTVVAGAGAGADDGPTFHVTGAAPAPGTEGPPPVFTLDSGNARPGTASECAALRATVADPTP
jgi:hypothetical protein